MSLTFTMTMRGICTAAVISLFGWLAAAQAVENLEAGKTPAQIFSGTCNACHKSPRGLLKTVSPGSLPGFLRQHYTTSSDMAGILSAYVISNGATDTRYQSPASQQPKGVKDGPKEAGRDRPDRPAAGQDAPERAGNRQTQTAGRDPDARPTVRPDGEGILIGTPPPEREGRKASAKQKLSKRGKPGEDVTKPDGSSSEGTRTDAPKNDPDLKPDAARITPSEPAKDQAKSEPAKDVGTTTSSLRPDPVPPVTPAPSGTVAAPAAASTAAVAAESTAAALPAMPVLPSAPPPMPQLPPVPPAGPPAPPISQ